MPPLDPAWFFPGFVLLWLAISAVVSAMGGWREFADRFRSDEHVEGERFRFRSGSIGAGRFPVNYRNCLFSTVGEKSFSLSILFIFRFMHPRLVIPWSAVERCEQVRFWFTNVTAVHLAGFSPRILLGRGLGEKVFEAWSRARDSKLK